MAANNAELNELLRKFHNKFASNDVGSKINDARRDNMQNMEYFRSRLIKHDLCNSPIQYMGSAYEVTGVYVDNDIVDFDVMFVLNLKDVDVVSTGMQQYRMLKTTKSETLPKLLKDRLNDNFINAKKVASGIFGILQSAINENEKLKSCSKLRQHGPAVQIDVYKDSTKKELFYHTDVVFTLNIIGSSAPMKFVAKPSQNDLYWRLTFSEEEKTFIKGLTNTDPKTGNFQKMVYRVVKAICANNAELKKLTTYHIKTAFIHAVREEQKWTEDVLADRVLGLLNRLEHACAQKELLHCFFPSINLLDDTPEILLANMRDRLKRLQITLAAFLKSQI